MYINTSPSNIPFANATLNPEYATQKQVNNLFKQIKQLTSTMEKFYQQPASLIMKYKWYPQSNILAAVSKDLFGIASSHQGFQEGRALELWIEASRQWTPS